MKEKNVKNKSEGLYRRVTEKAIIGFKANKRVLFSLCSPCSQW